MRASTGDQRPLQRLIDGGHVLGRKARLQHIPQPQQHVGVFGGVGRGAVDLHRVERGRLGVDRDNAQFGGTRNPCPEPFFGRYSLIAGMRERNRLDGAGARSGKTGWRQAFNVLNRRLRRANQTKLSCADTGGTPLGQQGAIRLDGAGFDARRRGDAAGQRGEFHRLQKGDQLFPDNGAHAETIDRLVERYIAVQRHQLHRDPRQFCIGDQRLAPLRLLDLAARVQQRFEIAIGLISCAAVLMPMPGTPGTLSTLNRRPAPARRRPCSAARRISRSPRRPIVDPSSCRTSVTCSVTSCIRSLSEATMVTWRRVHRPADIGRDQIVGLENLPSRCSAR
jgi:hypothetical protein